MCVNMSVQAEVKAALGRRAAAVLLSVLLALILILLTLPTVALAVPDGGASPDTPGTYAEASPKELRPGATIQFAVSGYPGGEVLNIKIDDGAGYSDQGTAGTGVVHTQIIGASGSTSGSFKLPGDISEGWHWLRFLASEVVSGKGVLGYTNGAGSASNTSHPTAFYVSGESLGGASARESVVASTSPGVVSATQGGSNSSNTSGGSGSAGSSASGQSTGGTGTEGTDGTLADTGEEGTDVASMTDEEAAQAAGAAVLNRTSADAQSPKSSGVGSPIFDALPLPGLITLGAVLIVGVVALLLAGLKRLKPAMVGGIDAADGVGDGVSFGGGFGEGFSSGPSALAGAAAGSGGSGSSGMALAGAAPMAPAANISPNDTAILPAVGVMSSGPPSANIPFAAPVASDRVISGVSAASAAPDASTKTDDSIDIVEPADKEAAASAADSAAPAADSADAPAADSAADSAASPADAPAAESLSSPA